MFAPTKTWRRWHRKVAVNQRRYATVSAIAATAVPSLVFARGHRISAVQELPLVLSNEAESAICKTKRAVEVLKAVGAYADVERVIDSRTLRAGKGKARNRRFRQRRGPLVVINDANKDSVALRKSLRNIPGVEVAPVSALNLLLLAPGGHLGRLVIWTEGAFASLQSLYGSFTEAAEKKSGYFLPQPMLSNTDIGRIINSDEVQSKLRPAKDSSTPRSSRRRNPLRNVAAMVHLNPYVKRARELEAQRQGTSKKRSTVRASAAFVTSIRDETA